MIQHGLANIRALVSRSAPERRIKPIATVIDHALSHRREQLEREIVAILPACPRLVRSRGSATRERIVRSGCGRSRGVWTCAGCGPVEAVDRVGVFGGDVAAAQLERFGELVAG